MDTAMDTAPYPFITTLVCMDLYNKKAHGITHRKKPTQLKTINST